MGHDEHFDTTPDIPSTKPTHSISFSIKKSQGIDKKTNQFFKLKGGLLDKTVLYATYINRDKFTLIITLEKQPS